MKRILVSSAIDLIAGLAGTAVVLVATDSLGVDLRVYLVTAVTVFLAIGLWRGGSEGLPAWVRLLLICVMPFYSAVSSGFRHWPLDAGMFLYTALFPATQWAFAALGFRLRSGPAFDRRRWVTALGAALVGSALVAAVTMPSFSRWLATDTTVRPMPPIAFETFDLQTVRSEDWTGKVVLIDFWASWCVPCVAELREIDALYARYGDRDDVVFWAVGAQDERQAAERFAATSSYSFPWAWDPDNAAFDALGTRTVPSLYLIDRQGRIRLTHVGYTVDEGLEEHVGRRLAELIAEPPPGG